MTSILRSLLILFLSGFAIALTASDKWQDYTISNSGLLDNTIRAILLSDDGSAWIGTDWGLAHFADTSWTVYLSSNSPLPDNSIRSLALDDQSRLWIGTFGGGLAIKDDTSWTIYDPGNSDLPDFHVRAIKFEQSGKAWIGTTGGIVSLEDTAMEVFNTFNTPELWSNNYTSIAIDTSDNSKWFGSINGGVAIWNDTIWEIMRNVNSGIPDNTILDLEFDHNNNIWFATPASGISFFNKANWVYFNIVNSNIPTNSVNSLSICPAGDVYTGSIDKGMLQFKISTDWTSFNTDSSDILDDQLVTVQVGNDGRIWAGTLSSGLSVFTPELKPVFVDDMMNEIEEISLVMKNDSTLDICLDVLMDGEFTSLDEIISSSLGTVNISNELCLEYLPDSTSTGTDSFYISACIEKTCLSLELCDTLRVLVEVLPKDTIPAGVQIPSINDIKIFPSLFDDQITVRFNTTSEMPLYIEFYDILGNRVLDHEISQNQGTVTILSDNLSQGPYLLSVVYPHNTLTKKILKINR